jgi:hypothetical protein
LEPVLHLGEQKLTGVFPRSLDEEVLSGPLELVRCVPEGDHSCGLLQLRHSFPPAAMYGSNYGYRSGLNSSMVRHLENKTSRLLALANPAPGSLLVDIGSNDGTLLNSYPKSFQRVGIDPVAVKFLHFYDPDISVVTDFFSSHSWEKHLGAKKASLITSVAMFYDLEQPLAFVKDIAAHLAPEGLWHFEQSYMPLMLKNLAYDTICHEHITYYALRQIDWALRRSGLKLIALHPSDVNGGSLSLTAALATSSYPEAVQATQSLLAQEREMESMAPLFTFRDKVFHHRDALKATLRNLRAQGAKVLGYGASTKGNVLLQFCHLSSDDLPLIGEINPEKFGAFTPGTGIPIVSEEAMHKENPDVLLVLPWHFRESIIQREHPFIARGGRLLFPLPDIGFYPH